MNPKRFFLLFIALFGLPNSLTNAESFQGTGSGESYTGTTAADLVSMGGGADTASGGDGDDIIAGDDGADTLSGDAGSDILVGGSFGSPADTAANSFAGGTGNDLIYGGNYGDTYTYNSGDGFDVIHEPGTAASQVDKVVFGAGISSSSLTFSREWSDLFVELPAGDILRIDSWFGSSTGEFQIEDFQFDSDPTVSGSTLPFDGTTWNGTSSNDTYMVSASGNFLLLGAAGGDTLTASTGNDVLVGGAGNDTLAARDGNDALHGEDGNDVLYGENGADALYGGAGTDQLWGGDGNDQLNSGLGNDTLLGGTGSDSYIWYVGDGDDTIQDDTGYAETASVNHLKFGPGISPSDVSTEPVSGTFALKFVVKQGGVTNGSVIVSYWLNNHTSTSTRHCSTWRIVFMDGTVWDGRTLGTPLADVISGTGGADSLYGGGGNDTINGGNGNDVLYGEDGADTLNGEAGDDTLDGGSGNDSLVGSSGNDSLTGGLGDDSLSGGAGSDLYFWNVGDGDDTIQDDTGFAETAAVNHLKFGSGILPSDVSMEPVSGTFALKFVVKQGGVTNGSVIVSYWLNNHTSTSTRHGSTWRIEFLDGTVWNGATLGTPLADVLYGTSSADTLYGGGGNDTLSGGNGNDILYGEDGADTLNGEAGDDTLDGGNGNDALSGSDGNDSLTGRSGDDTLSGGLGNDSYFWNAGDGNDSIQDDTGYDGASAVNHLVFGSGISPSDVTLEAVSGAPQNLKFVIRQSGVVNGSVIVAGWAQNHSFTSTRHSTTWRIDFAGGTTWNGGVLGTPLIDNITGTSGADTINGLAGNDILSGAGGNDTLDGGDGDDTLNGEEGNDTLAGRAGNDTLNGGNGNDLYLWNSGDGNDIIGDSNSEMSAVNRLVFGTGISPSDVSFESVNTLDIRLNVSSGGSAAGSVRINSWNYVSGANRSSQTWRIEFADGTLWDGRFFGTDLNDTLTGTSDADSMYGRGGNDTISGNDGNDILGGDDGNDTLNGGNGDDQLIGGNGNDVLNGNAGTDTLLGGAGTDTIDGGAGDDTLAGGTGDDAMQGGDGNDIFQWNTGDGNDTVSDSGSDAGISHILFGSGILPENVTIEATGTMDLKFNIAAGGSVTVLNWNFTGISGRHADGWRIEFAGGTVWDGRRLGTPYGDVLTGTNGADSLDGKAGNDTVNSGDANDTLVGGDGNDELNGENGDDELAGDAGTDVLDGGAGDDTLDGGDGGDQLSGGDGTDTMEGGNGDDALSGGTGSDVLSGGPGNDTLYGMGGNDTYLWNIGDGSDTIQEDRDDNNGPVNQLVFGEAILPEDITCEAVSGAPYDLRLVVNDGATVIGSVVIQYWNYSNSLGRHSQTWVIRFANGTAWDGRLMGTLLTETINGTDDGETINLGDGNDTGNGWGGDDILEGGNGNDTLGGGDGNDTLSGNVGNDILYGDDGVNRYLYGSGDGNDTIFPNTYHGSTKDTLDLGDFARSDVSIDLQTEGAGFKILITVLATNETILIHNGDCIVIEFSDTSVEFNADRLDIRGAVLEARAGWKDQDEDGIPDDVENALQDYDPLLADPEDDSSAPAPDAFADASITTASGNHYPTLKAAISAAGAARSGRPYIVVKVLPGIYQEDLDLNVDGIYIQGPGSAGRATLLKGRASGSHFFRGSKIVVEGLCIGESQAALRISLAPTLGSGGIRFVNCLFKDQNLSVSSSPTKAITVSSGEAYFLHCSFLRLSGMEVSANANVAMANSMVDVPAGATWPSSIHLRNFSTLFGSVSTSTPGGLGLRSDGLLKVSYPARTSPGLDHVDTDDRIEGLRDLDGEVRETASDSGCDEYIDTDASGAGDHLPDSWEQGWFGSITPQAAAGDPDSDSHDNLAEYDAETNPLDAVAPPSSGPPVNLGSASSYEEISLPGVAEWPTVASGRWMPDNDGKVTFLDRQGTIDYRISIDEAVIAALLLDVDFINISQHTSYGPTVNGGVRIYLDDQLVYQASGAIDNLLVPLHSLSVGEHIIRLELVNHLRDYRPVVNLFSVRELKPELASSLLEDVLLQAANGLTTLPIESLVSPAFVEGTSAHRASIGVKLTATEEEIPVNKGPEQIWYADVPLDPTGVPTAITLSLERGAETEEHGITWKATVMENVPTLTIRKGDSLRLMAEAATASSGANVTYWIGGIQIGEALKGTALAYPFGTAGSATVTAKVGGVAIAGAQTIVTVVEADFGDASAALKGARGAIQVPLLTPSLVVEGPTSLNLSRDGAAFSVYPERVGSFRVVARIGSSGPIVASGLVNVFQVAASGMDGGGRVITTFLDGHDLVNMTYTVDGIIPPNLLVKIQLWIPGTTFLDGSTIAWLTAEDFNEAGVANIQVLAVAGGHGICQYVNYYLSEEEEEEGEE